jgi:hypothetical protein
MLGRRGGAKQVRSGMEIARRMAETGVTSQNVTPSLRISLTMTEPEQSGQYGNDGAGGDAAPPCTALVPLTPGVHWSRAPGRPLSRADFVTQLIATAEQAPQTCRLRRASAADAQLAYGANRQQPGAGTRTRQVI